MKEKRPTVRFAQLVQRYGHPHPVTLWTAPEKDPEFMAAVRQHQILTLHQSNVGTKRDFGEVGFHPSGPALYLRFPKSLEPEAGKEVIGIKYDLLESLPSAPPEKAPVRSAPRQEAKRAHPVLETVSARARSAAKSVAPSSRPFRARTKAPPAEPEFEVSVRITAERVVRVKVRAPGMGAAEENALREVRGQEVDWAQAPERYEVIEVKKR